MRFHVDIPRGPASVLVPMQRIADIPTRADYPIAFLSSEVQPDLGNSTVVYQPGPLISYRGKRVKGVNHPCFHVNLVGDYYLHSNRDEADIGYTVSHRDNVPAYNYDIPFPRFESLSYYDPEHWNGYRRRQSVGISTHWYVERISSWNISPTSLHIHYSYRNVFSGRENNAEEYDIVSVARERDGDILTFHCEKRARSHMTGKGPPDPYPWSDPVALDLTFRYILVEYETLMTTRAQLEMLSFERRLDIAIANCMKANGDAVRCSAIADAVRSVEMVDMNNIENLSQLGIDEVISPLKDFIQLARNYDDPVQWAKTSASLFLFWKYAVKPTVSDVREAMRISRQGYSDILSSLPSRVVVRGRSSHFDTSLGVNTDAAALVTVIPTARDAVSSAITSLDKLGLALTPSNAWDVVPFSFVVDWFANTNDILDIMSSSFHSYRYRVGEIVASYRSEQLVTSARGRVQVVVYDRSVTTSFPPLSLQGRDAWRSHIMEGAALIVG